MSICSRKSRRISRSATSCGASREARRIGCKWCSLTYARGTGDRISGLGATFPPPAATSRTVSYFSIFRSTDLPASAGRYFVNLFQFYLIGANCRIRIGAVAIWAAIGFGAIFGESRLPHQGRGHDLIGRRLGEAPPGVYLEHRDLAGSQSLFDFGKLVAS